MDDLHASATGATDDRGCALLQAGALCCIELKDVGHHQQLKIVAEKSQYTSTVKTLKKQSNRMFPGSVFLKLEPAIVPSQNTSGQIPSANQQQTTIQGPTIIMPGSGPAPQVVQPTP